MQTRQARLLAKIEKRPKLPSFCPSRSNMNRSLPPFLPRGNFNQKISPNKHNPNFHFDRKISRQPTDSKVLLLLFKLLGLTIIGLLCSYLIYPWLILSNNSLISNSTLYQSTPNQIIRDKIMLYRILGNDLPPRHKAGQTLRNVRFILEHESEFLDTKKWWILNRIADSDYENALINLLKLHKQDYIRIPFNEDEYSKLDFRLDDFPIPDFFNSVEFMRYSKVSKLRTIDYTYINKNLYVMNNNGGRNVALSHGKSQLDARWILPFDGNCFLTPNAFADIRSHLDLFGDQYKYFIVPMARLLNNSQLLEESDVRPTTPEEPQIIFKHDSDKLYNEKMRYGRRSKLEMLWRLGVPPSYRLNNTLSVPWEPHSFPDKVEEVQYMSAGWVFRLFSGQMSQETKEAGSIRSFNRLLAIQNFIDGLDEHIARKVQGFDPFRLFLYDENLLNKARLDFWLGVPKVTKVVKTLIKHANNILSETTNLYESEPNVHVDANIRVNFLKIKQKESNIKSNFYQDFMLVNMTRNPHLDLSGLMKDSFRKKTPMQSPVTLPTVSPDIFFENVITLSLAHYFSGDEQYSRWAANLIRTFILSSYAIGEQDNVDIPSYMIDNVTINNEGYSFPYLNKIPRMIPKFLSVDTSFSKNLFNTDPSFFLDACRLLYRAHVLNHKEYMSLRNFASDWLELLINSPQNLKIGKQSNHRGTMFDLQVISLSGFVDDIRLYLRVANRVRMRIGKQFNISLDASTPKIFQNHEMMYVQNLVDTNEIKSSDYDENIFRYTTLNLQYWLRLVRIIQNGRCGSDIWQYKTKDEKKISKAVIEHFKHYKNRMHDSAIITLAHITKSAFNASGIKRDSCPTQDEYNYSKYFKKIDEITNKIILYDQTNEKEFNTVIGIGDEARRKGLPPFWMFGVA
ncbi:14324_t:CDS:2 [Cetraspora pellucida]|uniref:14324_t:CDS:1 n=1 Tax=Cetraspora pellucida TaxID=1433469 RepID=A0A9N9CGW9_9GLOM|nr:14324_t:CDS:2 [Cetraspora pellucida]